MPLQDHEIPTVFIVGSPTNEWWADVSSSVIYDTTDSGTTDVFIDYSRYNAEFVGLEVTETEVTTVDSEASFDNTAGTVQTGDATTATDSLGAVAFFALKSPHSHGIDTEWFLSPKARAVFNDTYMDFRINLGAVPVDNDMPVEMFFSAVKHYNYLADVYCCLVDMSKDLTIDIETQSGRLDRLSTDIYASTSGTYYMDTSIFSTRSGVSGTLQSDVITSPGGITDVDIDIYSCELGISEPTGVDFKTRSLFTGDFFLSQDHFTTASSIAWVDVVDYLYPVDVYNTFLYVDGVLASGVYFEDIPYGIRLYYDPLDDFYADGVLRYSIHAENIIGEVEEKDFYLLFGYDLQLNEVVDWGPNSQILVRAEAQNLVFCPNLAGAAYDFTTVDLTSFNLRCTINPVGYVDLAIQIVPQSTVFFYGKTYTVRLQNVKDYAGNIMPDLEYTFTIENPLA